VACPVQERHLESETHGACFRENQNDQLGKPPDIGAELAFSHTGIANHSGIARQGFGY